MQAQKHYSRAPITEALIDIQVQLPQEVKLEVLAQVYSSIQSEYPNFEEMLVFQGQMIAGASVEATASQSQIGYRAFSKEQKQILQVRLDGFTFSRLAPYDCWETFRDEAKRLWSIYQSLTNPAAITRLAVRYINRLDIPLPVSDLNNYLRTFPEVSSDLPQGLSGYFMQLQIPQEKLATMLVLNQALVPPPTPNFISILLDLDLFLERDIPQNEIELWEIVEQMHEQKNKAFEACITEHTRELIN
ncbi:TIGR04255 family protein [Nostoc sp. FACHB-87]|uniref:TIGR04255 family protein n=1 Tax=Nostocales TaxID=1161 RepID=UPI00168871A0|nr:MULTISPECIES: TIGR04255 family protein [Nostocales]MBD2298205.1 TIGR04255 family protein [Nostoc sp. FACHB-190]MBD2453144.1 TIGR04255 family protein [Nostoc sp. FACHB-87]MBD2475077.1 TIGR04255 family protein [Anabaena sp. FACHB-83]MBD2489361.1 TIGR04255 family protein [Aulosira sp. FACHB-615]